MRIHSREKIVMSKLLINCLLQMPYRIFFIFPTYVTTLRTCELVVNNTVDSKDNLEADTMKLLKTCITLIGIFFNEYVIQP